MANKLKNISSPAQRRICMLSKIHVTLFPQESRTIIEDLLELIHSDVCGQLNINSLGGARYFTMFIDDYSRRIFAYFTASYLNDFELFFNRPPNL